MDVAESLTAVLGEGANVCLSGGADGSDLQWGLQAGKAGHSVIHWSFQGHRTLAPEQEVVQLTQEQLELADGALRRANKQVKRAFPSKTESTNNLLRRNWYQVKDTSAVYAVSEFDKKTGGWAGGTAWAIQMYLDRFIHDGLPMEDCRCYVLDRLSLYWYHYFEGKWAPLAGRPPIPSGIWTGIGSREISALCRVEIRKTMGTYALDDTQLNSLFPIVENPQVGDTIYVPDRKIPGEGSKNRNGGWATIRRISTGDRIWVSVVEFSDNDEFDWENTLKHEQIELRAKHKLDRACAKPDFSPENNTK